MDAPKHEMSVTGPPTELPTFEELDAAADAGELTQTSLQEKLNAYRQAFEEEYRVAAEAEPTDVVKHTLDYFKKQTPDASAQIVWLAHNAESEAVRKDCLKFIIMTGMSDAQRDGDPIKEMLASLTKPQTPANSN